MILTINFIHIRYFNKTLKLLVCQSIKYESLFKTICYVLISQKLKHIRA